MTARLLLVSGSLRAGSTNTAVLRAAIEVAPAGTAAALYDGVDRLPPFNPDHDTEPLHPAVAELRAAVDRADALLVSTPEYAGALPGSFKNVLDWLVGNVGTAGKAVAWVNTSTAAGGAASAHASLRTVLSWVDADIVTAACAHIPVPRTAIGPDGRITDPAIRAPLTTAVAALVEGATSDRRLQAGTGAPS
jgi:NAD(P)H-dependent FMN reductase